MDPQDSPDPEITLAEQVRLVAAWRRELESRPGTGAVELIETHISFVLVGTTTAYKFRKAVNPGFLDFRSYAQRRADCERELRLNRRLAPDLYLGLAALRGTPEAPRQDGEGPLLDCAVVMKAFDQNGLWDRLAARGELGAAAIDALAQQIAAFHRGAARADPQSRFGRPAQVHEPMRDNFAALENLLPAQVPLLQQMREREERDFAALAPRFEARRTGGHVRECHGDLHLGNVVQIEGRTTAFDCIEFNDDFRWIDVMNEIAFMAMDLEAHARPGLAHRFVDAYLQASGDYEGLAVLRWYLGYRALVRAKVAALRASQSGGDAAAAAGPWIELAQRFGRAPPPQLLITHGFSGSGKTTLSQGLVEACGVIRIRSDVERKRLAGLDALASSGSALGEGLYDAAAGAALQARLLEAAGAALDGGWTVLLDATFLKRAARDAVRGLAEQRGVRFVILDFELDHASLFERVQARAARADDASEAGVEVLQAQLRSAEALGDDERGCVVSVPQAGADWARLLAP